MTLVTFSVFIAQMKQKYFYSMLCLCDLWLLAQWRKQPVSPILCYKMLFIMRGKVNSISCDWLTLKVPSWKILFYCFLKVIGDWDGLRKDASVKSVNPRRSSFRKLQYICNFLIADLKSLFHPTRSVEKNSPFSLAGLGKTASPGFSEV